MYLTGSGRVLGRWQSRPGGGLGKLLARCGMSREAAYVTFLHSHFAPDGRYSTRDGYGRERSMQDIRPIFWAPIPAQTLGSTPALRRFRRATGSAVYSPLCSGRGDSAATGPGLLPHSRCASRIPPDGSGAGGRGYHRLPRMTPTLISLTALCRPRRHPARPDK